MNWYHVIFEVIAASNVQGKLNDKLLHGYDVLAMPRHMTNETVLVKLGLNLLKIMDVVRIL